MSRQDRTITSSARWHPRLFEIGCSGVCLARYTTSRHRQTNSGEPDCPTEADDSESLNTTGSASGTAWSSCHREEHCAKERVAVLLQLEGWVMRCRCKHDCAFNGRREMFDRDGWQPTNKLCWTSFPDSEDEGANCRRRGAGRSASVPDATPEGLVPGPGLVRRVWSCRDRVVLTRREWKYSSVLLLLLHPALICWLLKS